MLNKIFTCISKNIKNVKMLKILDLDYYVIVFFVLLVSSLECFGGGAKKNQIIKSLMYNIT